MVISICSSVKYSSVPVYDIFEKSMQKVLQIVWEVTVVKSIKCQHLTHQECLEQFLIEKVPPISVSSFQMRTIATTHSDHSSKHCKQKEDKSENCPNEERLFSRTISMFFSSPRRIIFSVIFLFDYSLLNFFLNRINIVDC